MKLSSQYSNLIKMVTGCLIWLLMAVSFHLPLLAYGREVPIEELSVDKLQQQPVKTDQSPEGLLSPSSSTEIPRPVAEQRLARLQQQMENLIQMNLPQQISDLRDQMQKLVGQLQVQQHDIKLLENQQRSFYQDLSRRVQQIANPHKMPLTRQQQPPIKLSKQITKDATAYRMAFQMLMKKQYDDALAAFQEYSKHYPRGNFIANAYYWIGELYLQRKDTTMAKASFSRVVTQYSHSNKVPDAKLKLAMIAIDQGKKDQGRKQLQLIKHQYPNSTAAQLATIQLQRINQ